MIKLSTIILPRLEFHFLKEWIDHYLALGVQSINIYDNGEFPVASPDAHWLDEDVADIVQGRQKYRTSSKNLVWDKKPHLNYFDEVPYTEIQNKLRDISNRYKEVSIIPWVCGVNHNYGYPESQKQMLISELRNGTDWFLNIDPDEFLKLPAYDNNLHDLIKYEKKYNHFYFGQFTGERRKVNVPIENLKVYKHFRAGLNRKWLCDLSRCKNFNIPHRGLMHNLNFENPVEKILTKDEAYFIHYKADGIDK